MGVDTRTGRDTTELNREELIRYSRHILLPQVGEEGQRALKDSRVLLIGAGGLGSPVARYLAAAGVGTLGVPELGGSRLFRPQRQRLYGLVGGCSHLRGVHSA